MPRKKADYPDWVMKYKEKGTYINKVGDKYYLYAAHSERIKGTDRVRRVSDGYIGRITKEDGLIKSGSSFKNPPTVYETGMSFAILSVTEKLLDGFNKSFRKNGKLVYCSSIIAYIYGSVSKSLFERSCLSLIFADIIYPDKFSAAQNTGIERGIRMLDDILPKTFGDDLIFISRRFPDIRLVKVGKHLYLCGLDEDMISISKKYGIDWEETPWQK